MRTWLVDIRKSKGISQYEAANLLHMSQSYYAAIEVNARQKDMDISIMEKLAAAFEISIQKIVEAESKYRAERNSA